MNSQTSQKLEVILDKIHELQNKEESAELQSLRKEAHLLVSESDITYREVYCAMKQKANSRKEFNTVMKRIRETILEREK